LNVSSTEPKDLPSKQSLERVPGNSPTIMLWKLLPSKLRTVACIEQEVT